MTIYCKSNNNNFCHNYCKSLPKENPFCGGSLSSWNSIIEQFKPNDLPIFENEKITKPIGERVPRVNDSQKDFRILTVLISKEKPKEAVWQKIKEQLQWFTKKGSDQNKYLYNFWEATKGMASLEADNLINFLAK